MRKKDEKTNRFPIAIPLIIFVMIFLALFMDIKQSTDRAYDRASEVLRDSAESQSILLVTTLDDCRETLDGFAMALGNQKSIKIPNAIIRMRAIAKVSKMHHVAYADLNGTAYLDNGQSTNVADRSYYKQALKGIPVMQYIKSGRIEKECFFILAVPIEKNNKVIGIVYGSFDEKTMCDLLISTAYSNDAYSFVCNSSGDIVIGSDSSDFIENSSNIVSFLKTSTIQDSSAASVGEDLKNSNGNVLIYKKDGHKKVAVYQPIDIPYIINDKYYIFNVVSSTLLTGEVTATAKDGLFMILSVSLLFILILIYIWNREKKNRLLIEKHQQQFLIAVRQSKKSLFRYEIDAKKYYKAPGVVDDFNVLYPDTIENVPETIIDLGLISEESIEEYRNFFRQIDKGVPETSCTVRVVIPQSKVRQLWYRNDSTTIFDDHGNPLEAIISSYDVTDQRKKEVTYSKWLQELEAMPKNKTSIFEWNMSQDLNESDTDEFIKIFGDKPLLTFNRVSQYFANLFLCKEDRQEYLTRFNRENLLMDYNNGITEHTMEIRKLGNRGPEDHIWINIRVQLVPYPYSQEIKAYIIIKDIDEEKRRELALRKKSEEDNLTGILNRISFESKLDTILKESPEDCKHAVVMMDIDNFKAINDDYGHRQGDRTLIETAQQLRSALRDDDLLARLGGDEFIILLKDFSHDSDIENKVSQLINAVRALCVEDRRISMSMGIAVYPRDGQTFDELYQNSDSALYFAKESGKNRYAFYSQEL